MSRIVHNGPTDDHQARSRWTLAEDRLGGLRVERARRTGEGRSGDLRELGSGGGHGGALPRAPADTP